MSDQQPDNQQPPATPPSAAPASAQAEAEVVIRYGGEPDAERIPVTVHLAPRHHAYLVQRAAMHGETPEKHLETILRNFRSYYDDQRPELTAAEPQRNGGAVTRRLP